MANSWFEFRTFRIHQDRCGMKVSTDACLQGAWAPFPVHAERILDVGTGTGLLALLLAQRYPQAQVTALELLPEAAAQAAENVAQSPYHNRIQVACADARLWQPPALFDALICNPPFFHRSLQGPDPHRNTARHSHSFDFGDLIDVMDRCLAASGMACVLLPAERQAAWEAAVTGRGWHRAAALEVCPRGSKAANRWISCWTRDERPSRDETIAIYEAPRVYTPAATRLLAPFYRPEVFAAAGVASGAAAGNGLACGKESTGTGSAA